MSLINNPSLCLAVTEPSVLRGALCGHTDAVWGLVYSSAHQRLLSCSADGTVRLWSAADTSPALAVFNEDTGNSTKLKSHPHLHIQNYLMVYKSKLCTFILGVLCPVKEHPIIALCCITALIKHCHFRTWLFCFLNNTLLLEFQSRIHTFLMF